MRVEPGDLHGTRHAAKRRKNPKVQADLSCASPFIVSRQACLQHAGSRQPASRQTIKLTQIVINSPMELPDGLRGTVANMNYVAMVAVHALILPTHL
jgi:hypothetical protein